MLPVPVVYCFLMLKAATIISHYIYASDCNQTVNMLMAAHRLLLLLLQTNGMLMLGHKIIVRVGDAGPRPPFDGMPAPAAAHAGPVLKTSKARDFPGMYHVLLTQQCGWPYLAWLRAVLL